MRLSLKNVSTHAHDKQKHVFLRPMSRNDSTDELYFVTLTVTDWIDVFTRRFYNDFDFIINNLIYCQNNKGLNVYAYVIMTNHIHLVAPCRKRFSRKLLRNFKTYTS